MWKRLLLAASILAIAVSAMAFERPFPPIAKRGKLVVGAYPAVLIDGKPRVLAAGGKIWNEDNLIQMPSSFDKVELVVNYTENDAGEIDRVWLLRPYEAAQTPAQQNIQTK